MSHNGMIDFNVKIFSNNFFFVYTLNSITEIFFWVLFMFILKGN